MATNFPSGLDALSNPTSTTPVFAPGHAAQHANANDAIEALQAKVGVDSSAVATSLDYKVGALETKTAGATAAEIAHLSGVTSPIQSQLDGKIGINTLLYSFLYGGATFEIKSVYANMTSSNTEIYTVPAGKKSIVYGAALCTSNGSNYFQKFYRKRSGTNYPIYFLSVGTASSTNAVIPVILYEGETLVMEGGQSAINGWFTIYEISSPSASLKYYDLPSLSSGDNTLYTVPIGKKAYVLSDNLFSITSTNRSTVVYANTSSGTVVYKAYLVKNGGSVSDGYIIRGAVSINNSTSVISLTNLPTLLEAGDAIVLNVNSSNSGQYAHINVLEI